jgi:hypothetical protein
MVRDDQESAGGLFDLNGPHALEGFVSETGKPAGPFP